MSWVHVYDQDDDNKYVGFFGSEAKAKAWVKTQKNRTLEITDRPPKRPDDVSTEVDRALDQAIAATKEASDDGGG